MYIYTFIYIYTHITIYTKIYIRNQFAYRCLKVFPHVYVDWRKMHKFM